MTAKPPSSGRRVLPLLAERDHARAATSPASPLRSCGDDSYRNRLEQGVSASSSPLDDSYAPSVAKKGTSGGTKSLPPEVAEAIAQRLNEWFDTYKWTHERMVVEWGIDKATISKARNQKQGVGIHTVLRIADKMNVPLDYLMGRPQRPWPKQARPADDHEEANRWPHRHVAAGRAIRAMGIPQHVVDAVVSAHEDPIYKHQKETWWVAKFQQAYAAELALQEEHRAVALAAAVAREGMEIVEEKTSATPDDTAPSPLSIRRRAG